jgi:hypothetical protein
MNKPYSWEVTFSAGSQSMTFTFARKSPGDAVTALWTELEAMPETRNFLRNVTRIRVKKIAV